jgi:uncharacterized SAM-binding protein YcdF (DUF218 family)
MMHTAGISGAGTSGWARKNRSIIIGIALILMLPLLFWITPRFLNRTAHSMIREDRLAKADLIVALGGDSRNHRELRAVELYKQGWGKKVVVSGVQIAWGIHTADVARKYVISLGVREPDVIAMRDVWNTRDEADEVSKIMAANNWRSAIIVTSAFHSRRALYTMERYAVDQTFYSSPVPPVAPEWQPDRWWSRRMDLEITIKEILSWANTVVGGWK